jgi:hypothetical protein
METTSEIKDLMLADKEKEIEQQGNKVEEQIAVPETQLATLASTTNDDQGQENEQSRLESIEEITTQQSLLCKEAQSKTHNERTSHIKKVTVSGKSGLLVGIINGEESNINQNIEDVSASDDSFGVVGIGRNIDTTEFFRRFRQ